MKNGFQLKTANGTTIRFDYYTEVAPVTCKAFHNALPFETDFYHAKVSGEEIWTPNGLELHIAHENSTVFIEEGEIVLGPMHHRNKIPKTIGILYGEGKLLDCGNIFGKVKPEDLEILKKTGNDFWLNGKQNIRFEAI
jgi:hypothetical protein